MGDVAAFEAAQHMNDRVDLADVGKELVAEPFALGRPAHQPGDVDELDLCLDLLGGTGDFADLVETRIGNGDTADVRLDRAKGIRSEEHTSELQSLAYLVCRLLLEKKKKR